MLGARVSGRSGGISGDGSGVGIDVQSTGQSDADQVGTRHLRGRCKWAVWLSDPVLKGTKVSVDMPRLRFCCWEYKLLTTRR